MTSPKGATVKAVVYQEPYKATVEEMSDFGKRIDGYTKVLIKPGITA